jgi:hypothetical protein
MGDSRIKDVSSLLASFFDEGKLRRGERYSDFFSSWPSFVGLRLAAHSRVADVDKGLLIVEAEHPGWIQLLQMRQSNILEGVASRFPELALKGIVFRLSGQAGFSRPCSDNVIVAEKTTIESETGQSEAPLAASGNDLTKQADPAFTALFDSLRKTMLDKK